MLSRYLFVFFGALATAVTAYLTLPQPASITSSSARLTAATAVTDSAGANLVVNGSFESPSQASAVTEYSAGSTDMPGWTVGGNSVDLVGSSYFQAEDGNQSLDLSGSTSGSVSQTVTTAPGSDYTLTWYMAGNPNCGQPVKTMQVSWDGQVVATRTFDTSTTTATSMGWTEEQLNVQATGTSSVLEFTDATPDASQCGATLDNVSLSAAQQVPPVFTQDSPALDALAGAPYSAIFFAEGVPVYQLVNAPSWLTITGNGAVTGTPPAGTSGFSYSVQASNAFGQATAGPYTVTVQQSADVSGEVIDGGIAANPVSGAPVQDCVSGTSECQQTTTGTDGTFDVKAPAGATIVLSAYPLHGSGDTATTTNPLTVPAGGLTGQTIALDGIAPITGGLEINGSTAPTVYWSDPAAATLSGCPDGFASVTVTGQDTSTGLLSSNITPLSESAPGSGQYSGTVPPQEPVHGPVDIEGSVVCAPQSALDPNLGSAAGGTNVIISGSGFTGATGVSFGSAPAQSFTVIADQVIEAVAPPGTGTVQVTVTTPASPGGIAVDSYTYVGVGSVSPASGPAVGGTWVTITGSGLTSATNVHFGSTPAEEIQPLSDTQLEALSPPGSGTADVTVDTLYGGTTPASAADQFSYGTGTQTSAARHVAKAAATGSVSPGSVHTASLLTTLVSLVSRYVSSEDAATYSTFYDLMKQIIKSNLPSPTCQQSADGLRDGLAAPLGPLLGQWAKMAAPRVMPGLVGFLVRLGVVGIAVTTLEPIVVFALGLLFAQAAEMVIEAVLKAFLGDCPPPPNQSPPPKSGPQGSGGTCVVASCTHRTNTGLVDPSGTVLDTNGNPVKGATVTILRSDNSAGPYAAVDPSSPGIQPSANPETTGTDGVFHWDVDSGWYEIQATAPGCTDPSDPAVQAVTAGPYPVPPPQTGLTITMACTGEPPAPQPVISSVSQGTGPASGGTQVTILGTGFTPGSKVTFGSTPASSVTYQSTQALSVISPADTGLADIRVQTAGGTSAAVAADQFYFGSPPAVTGLSPGHGPASGGTTVTITGTGFTGATAVAFGALPATAYTVVSGTQIQATAPAHLPGIADVLVTNPAGISTAAPADHFTYNSQPSIDDEVTASGTSTATATLSAAQGDLIVAFVSADGSPLATQQATVSGGGLTWTVARSTGTKSGTTAIWTARAASPLSGAAISAVLGTPGYREMLTVIAFGNATGVGRTVGASGASSAPTASLTTSVPGSWVFGVGYNHSPVSKPTLTPGSGQTLISQGSGTGSTFWTQSIAAPTPKAGTTVTVNDTAPDLNLWALTLIEIG